MRAILVIAIAATFVLAAWWNHASFAGTSLTGTPSVQSTTVPSTDPTALMSTMPPLPIQYYAPI